jgi:folate-binding protein YgfZ
MFVLRAKAKLSDLSATHRVLGVAGAGAEAALAQAGLPAPHGPLATAHADGVTVIRLADADGEPRWQIVARRAIRPLQHARRTLAGAAPAFWDWLDVGAGIPRIAAATQEQFVPQMINFELIGGVNFRKGCYPGQEVVARSQYRGTLKRRMWRVHGEGDVPAAAAEIFRPEDPEQPCGMVVNAAPTPAGRLGRPGRTEDRCRRRRAASGRRRWTGAGHACAAVRSATAKRGASGRLNATGITS